MTAPKAARPPSTLPPAKNAPPGTASPLSAPSTGRTGRPVGAAPALASYGAEGATETSELLAAKAMAISVAGADLALLAMLVGMTEHTAAPQRKKIWTQRDPATLSPDERFALGTACRFLAGVRYPTLGYLEAVVAHITGTQGRDRALAVRDFVVDLVTDSGSLPLHEPVEPLYRLTAKGVKFAEAVLADPDHLGAAVPTARHRPATSLAVLALGVLGAVPQKAHLARLTQAERVMLASPIAAHRVHALHVVQERFTGRPLSASEVARAAKTILRVGLVRPTAACESHLRRLVDSPALVLAQAVRGPLISSAEPDPFELCVFAKEHQWRLAALTRAFPPDSLSRHLVDRKVRRKRREAVDRRRDIDVDLQRCLATHLALADTPVVAVAEQWTVHQNAAGIYPNSVSVVERRPRRPDLVIWNEGDPQWAPTTIVEFEKVDDRERQRLRIAEHLRNAIATSVNRPVRMHFVVRNGRTVGIDRALQRIGAEFEANRKKVWRGADLLVTINALSKVVVTGFVDGARTEHFIATAPGSRTSAA